MAETPKQHTPDAGDTTTRPEPRAEDLPERPPTDGASDAAKSDDAVRGGGINRIVVTDGSIRA